MFRGIEIFNTIVSLIFNIIAIIGFYQGIEIIKSTGLKISPELFSTLLLFFLLYFLSSIAFFILRRFVKKNKITEKNTRPEIKIIPLTLYFIMGITAFPIWFYSSPTQLSELGQLIIIPIGIILSTIFIALITEFFIFLSDGGKYFKHQRKNKDKK